MRNEFERDWRVELVDLRSGERLVFASLDEAWSFLKLKQHRGLH